MDKSTTNVVWIYRGVAQHGSALRSGRRGPGFESRLPDQHINEGYLPVPLILSRSLNHVAFIEEKDKNTAFVLE